MLRQIFIIVLMGTLVICTTGYSQSCDYCWLDRTDSANTLKARIAVPDGFERVHPIRGTFAHWLQHLPLKGADSEVFLYDGNPKSKPDVYCAVVNIDVGDKDLQQCADAVIRMRAEYLYSLEEYDKIHFKFTSGHPAKYRQWILGYRPIVDQTRVNWLKKAPVDSSYSGFREYLDVVFTYAGTYSLSGELTPVADVSKMRIGDVFIQGGFPGHALIVVDMATDKKNGKSLFLLAQGFTPAQNIHILNNPNNGKLSPWYDLDFGDILKTPEWTFKKADLKRF